MARIILHVGIRRGDWAAIDTIVDPDETMRGQGISDIEFLKLAAKRERSSGRYGPHSGGFTILWRAFFDELTEPQDRIVAMVFPLSTWSVIRVANGHLYEAIRAWNRDKALGVKMFVIDSEGRPERLPER